jgi:hypothetical protein
VDSPKLRLRYESPGQAGGKGSKQPRPRRLPRINSPERNRTGGIKRSCGRQGDTRHNSSHPSISTPHLASSLTHLRPSHWPNRDARYCYHVPRRASETARPGGINSGGGKVRSHRGVRGGRGLVRHWPASPGEGDGRDQGGMGGTGKSEPNPPGPRPQKAAVGCAGGSGVVGWGAYGRSVTENISAGGRTREGVPPVARPYSGTDGRSSCLDDALSPPQGVGGARQPWARLPHFGMPRQRVDDLRDGENQRLRGFAGSTRRVASCLVKNREIAFFSKRKKAGIVSEPMLCLPLERRISKIQG